MGMRERGATELNPAWVRGPLGLGSDPTVPGGWVWLFWRTRLQSMELIPGSQETDASTKA